MSLSSIPDWLGTAIAGVITAVVGFLAKGEIERRKQIRASRMESRQRLKRLASLLEQSRSVFVGQNRLARRLSDELGQRLGKSFSTGRGFDEDFYVAYDQFTASDRELHALVRGTTMNSLRIANEQLAQWLAEDTEFKTYVGNDARRGELKTMLGSLERHLSLWLDKYRSVFLPDAKRSLVYLGDEKAHGEPFPHGLEEEVRGAIAQHDA